METFDPHKSTTEVRGANRRKSSFRVLIISVVGIIVIFAVIWGIYAFMPQGNVIQ